MLAKPNVSLRFDDPGLGKIRQNAVQAQASMAATQAAGKSMGESLAAALRGANVEFQRQRDLAKFWGTSSYMHQGIAAFKTNLGGMVAGAGQGFTGWIKGAIGHLAQYKNAIIAAGAAVAGLAIAAGVGSLRSKNYVESVLDDKLMERRLSDKAGASTWIENAQKTDWSSGRQERAGIFSSLMMKAPYLSQGKGQEFTEDLEKTFFAKQERLKDLGIGSSKDLAGLLTNENLSGDQANQLDAVFGLGFSKMNAHARLLRVSQESKGINMEDEMAKRPDAVLATRLSKIKEGFGNAMIPAVSALLGLLIKLTDAWGKFSKSSIGTAIFESLNKGIKYLSELGGGLFSKLGDAFGAADSAYSKGGGVSEALKSGLGVLLGTSSPVFKSLAFAVDFLKKLWVLTDGGTKIWKVISTVLEKVWGALNWVYGILLKIYNWLSEKIAWASGGLKNMLGVDKLDWTSLKPKLPTWENLFPKLPDWSNILDPLRNAITSFVAWLAETFPFLGINAGIQGINQATQGSINPLTGAINVPFQDKDVPRSNIDNRPMAYDSVGRPTYFDDTPAGLAAAKAQMEKVRVQRQKDEAKELNPGSGLLPWQGSFAKTATGETGIVMDDSQTDLLGVNPNEDPLGIDRSRIGAGTLPGTVIPLMPLPGAAAGGSIIGGGGLIGHSGEEVDPASVVTGGKTTLARINDLISESNYQGGQSITISAPITVNVGKVDSKVDLEKALAAAGEEFDRKLLFRLRNVLNTTGLRDIAYMRG